MASGDSTRPNKRGRARADASQAATAPAKLTPVMQQFADAKAQHPDAIVFFRLGDFYEMFFEDAVLASRLLNITLTSRNKEDPNSEPMAGVPHHAAHGYIAKLLAAGHKVALCEQLADPSKVKGIVPRAVVRVITPGLVTDDEQLDARDNHYLAAVEEGAVALLDLSTGELLAGHAPDTTSIVAELCRAAPAEILLAPAMHTLRATLALTLPSSVVRLEQALPAAPDAVLNAELGAEVASDAASALSPLERTAAARAVAFAAACAHGTRLPIRRVGSLDLTARAQIDETALAHLEIVRAADGGRRGSLLDAVDRTVTAGGARLLKRRLLSPLTEVGAIRSRLDDVETFVIHARVRSEVRTGLARVPDLERLAVRVSLGGATPRDLGLLRDGLVAAPAVARPLESIPASERALSSFGRVDALPEFTDRLAAALVDRPAPNKEPGFVRDGFDAALDEARATLKHGAERITLLEAALREETGAPGLKVRFNSVFGWYIEVTRSQLAKVPTAWRRKQTVATGERFTTPALDQLAADLETATDRARERELSILDSLLEETRTHAGKIRDLAATLSAIDVASALAELAHQSDYVRPTIDTSDRIDLEECRHPVVEQLAARGKFVPNDASLDVAGERLWLVTGPNMAGKSTFMRQVALAVVLAQAGSYVPARRARIGVVDRILSRVGASDNVARGESTFMVEMRETAAILRSATRRSLVILDEIGRGTSTYDGLAIAWAVAEHLHDVVRCRALFATHYHELTELASTAKHLANVSVSAREHDGGIVFLHTVSHGPASRSYGIAVAKLAGLPESVVARARALLTSFESDGAPNSSRGSTGPRNKRSASDDASQLALFAPPSSSPAEKAALETLRQLDVDRTTPLDALALLTKLKAALRPSS